MWGFWLGLAEFLGNTTVGVGGFCFLCGSFDSSPNVVSHDELLKVGCPLFGFQVVCVCVLV